ncbi:sugar ABC transporter substrate-binding protein [Microbacterium sp. LjRoot45]|uniref:Sugar ABC transporter substrate-binding protein n=1 Tax=Candidatus Microbacterium phytovorans TaxID=3121374 RepID=A0AAJ6B3E8_9MICO|nr:sugar ABC transporter substrate-binding protein [Microbacterium sp.]WEK12994.1 MAG: sugar ABC transporter substrate-binding protein [Microbacterium sp.]
MNSTVTKRILAAGVAIAALSLTACTTADAGTGEAPESKGAVAMGFAGADITIWNDQLEIMRPIVEAAGYEFLTDDPQWDVNRQVSSWQAWINRGDVKAIAGYPVTPDAMVPVTQQAEAAGIPVFGYLVGWEGTSGTTVVDSYDGGFELAANAATELQAAGADDDLTVVIVGSRDSDFSADAMDGLTEGFTSVMPDASIVEQTAITREDGYNITKAQMTADPESHVWLGASNDTILGVYQALIEEGVAEDDPNFYLASRDATNETLDLIKIENSIYRTSLVVPAQALAEANAKLLIDGAEGKETSDIVVPGVLVTAEDADDYYVG